MKADSSGTKLPKKLIPEIMTFLFDIGNVLLKLHFERFHETVLGAPDAPLPPDLALLKDPYETGQVSDEEFIVELKTKLSSSLTLEEITAAWLDIFSANDPMWELVRQLKRSNHRLILFSNTNNLHAQAFLADYPGFAHFDHHHFSHDIGSLKPNAAFYQRAIDHYQIDPSETFYLDDLAENIATGREFGFNCWQYDHENHEAFLEWFASHQIPLEPLS